MPVEHPDVIGGKLRLHRLERGFHVHFAKKRRRGGPSALVLGVLAQHPGPFPSIEIANRFWHSYSTMQELLSGDTILTSGCLRASGMPDVLEKDQEPCVDFVIPQWSEARLE